MKLNNKKTLLIAGPLIAVIGIFLFGHNVWAADWAVNVISGILSVFIWALGVILVLVIKGLILIASYQDFIGSQAVILGWVIVRDICNMFFVILLLIIAFGTILNIPDYSYKKWLPKLILMAVLINFSKTICGLMIDASQIVMLTFVNAFKDVGGANLTDILGLSKIVTLAKEEGTDVSLWTVVGAYVLGIIYLLIAVVVIVTMMMMLVMRLVMIWIYVVLSPLAYLLSAFPGGQKYSSQWWSEFTKNLIVGPVLAFFIWLSFAALQTYSQDTSADTSTAEEIAQTGNTSNGSIAATEASSPSSLIQFVIAIGMLLGGLKISQEIGGAAGSFAGKGMSALQKGQGWAMAGGKRVLTGDNLLARKFSAATGLDLRPIKLAESWKASVETAKRKDAVRTQEKARRHYEAGGLRSVALGMGAGEDYFNNYGSIKGIARAGKEVFYNKFKRGKLSDDIDAKQSISGQLQDKKEKLLASKNSEIEGQVKSTLAADSEYQKFKLSDNESEQLEVLKGKGKNASDEEKTILKVLEGKNAAAKNMEATVTRKIKKNIFESDKEIVDIEAKIKVNDGELRKLKDNMNKVQAPVAFEARSSYRKAVEEAKSKYKSITNSDELQKAYTDAEQRGDKFDQTAILEKLSSDANLNEELRTKGYSSNAIGLHAYTHNLENDFGERKGLKGNFSEKDRVQIENDLGELEERVGHWEMAKMCGVNPKGEMESYIKEMKDENGNIMKDKNGRTRYDDSQHAMNAYAEVIKFDPQKIVNSMNRLAMGGEDGSGKFHISNLGKMIFHYLASSDAYTLNSGRILGNTAANLVSGNNPDILRRVMADNPKKGEITINLLVEKGGKEGSNLAVKAYKRIEDIS